jgi:hypothetical protein
MMRRGFRTRAVATAAWLSVACATAGAASPYEIELSRPVEVGGRYRVWAEGMRSTSSEMTRGGEVLRREETTLRVELQALVEVLQVDRSGRPLKQALGLDYLVWGTGGELDQALPTGRVVIAETVCGATEFRLEQGRLPPLAAEALGLVVSTYRGDVPDEDLVFGTRLPRAVGESWPFHREAFADAMRTTGAIVDAARLQGQVRLERLERVAGVDCLRITAQVEVPAFSMPDLPEGVELERGRAEVSVSGLFPIDPARHKMQERTSVSMEVVLRGLEGSLAGAAVTTRSRQTGQKTLTPF